jgi:hypothetical protein
MSAPAAGARSAHHALSALKRLQGSAARAHDGPHCTAAASVHLKRHFASRCADLPKPILGEKIRYHREKVFKARLLPPPAVPTMDMNLHFAKVQRRWFVAPDEMPADQGLRLEQLALDMPDLPDFASAKTDVDAGAMVDQFFDGVTRVSGPAGGVVEEVRVEALDEEPERAANPEPRPTEEVTP